MSGERSSTGLILFSHGSVLCGAGQMLLEHAERLRKGGEFAAVEVGFLNYTEPTFLDAVQALALRGITRAVVAPYFLVPGQFVAIDIPRAVSQAGDSHPTLELIIVH